MLLLEKRGLEPVLHILLLILLLIRAIIFPMVKLKITLLTYSPLIRYQQVYHLIGLHL